MNTSSQPPLTNSETTSINFHDYNGQSETTLLATFQSLWVHCVEVMRCHPPQCRPRRSSSSTSSISSEDDISLNTLWQLWKSMDKLLTLLVDPNSESAQQSHISSSTPEEVERGLWNVIIWNRILQQTLDWAMSHAIYEADGKEQSGARNSVKQINDQDRLHIAVQALWCLLSFCEKLLTETRLGRETFSSPEVHVPLLHLAQCCQLLPASSYAQLYKRLVFYQYQLCIFITVPLHEQNSPPSYPHLILTLELLRGILNSQSEDAAAEGPHDPSSKYFLSPLLSGIHHEDADVSRWSREALMLLLNLTPRVPELAHFLASESDLCPVLATGLSACYSELPRELPLYEWSEDWCQLQQREWMSVPALIRFLTALEFCNYSIKVSHESIAQEILDLIYSGFLVSVVAPALHQTSLQEVVACTAYLELSLRRLREARLLAVFLRFILTEEFDATPLLSTLIRRINTNSDLSLVTLSLFRTMLQLHSEDVMFWLVFRHCEPPPSLSAGIFLQRSSTVAASTFLRECYESAAVVFGSLAESAETESEQERQQRLILHEEMLQRLQRVHNVCLTEWSSQYATFMPRIPGQELLEETKDHVDETTMTYLGEYSMLNSIPLFDTEEDESRQVEDDADGLLDMSELALPNNVPTSSLYRINYFLDDEEEDVGEEVKRSAHAALESGLHDKKERNSSLVTTESSCQTHSLEDLSALESKNPDEATCLDNFLEFLTHAVEPSGDGTLSTIVEEAVSESWACVIPPEDLPVKLAVKEKDLHKDMHAVSIFTSPVPQLGQSLEWMLSVLKSPFVRALLTKAGALPHNPIFVNLLLTEVLLELASFPHVLLHVPLLLYVRPHDSNSLFGILQEVESRMRAFQQQVRHFPRYQAMARRYLESRVVDAPAATEEEETMVISPTRPSETTASSSAAKLFGSSATSAQSFANFGSRLKQFFQFIPTQSSNESPASSSSSSSSWTQLGGEYRFCIDAEDLQPATHTRGGSIRQGEVDVERCAYESQRVRNYAYASILHLEFCRELQALCVARAQCLSQ